MTTLVTIWLSRESTGDVLEFDTLKDAQVFIEEMEEKYGPESFGYLIRRKDPTRYTERTASHILDSFVNR